MRSSFSLSQKKKIKKEKGKYFSITSIFLLSYQKQNPISMIIKSLNKESVI